jgi:hypothetical protein
MTGGRTHLSGDEDVSGITVYWDRADVPVGDSF